MRKISTKQRARQTAEKLVDRFERQVRAFETKREKFVAELNQDLSVLLTAYGSELVKSRISELSGMINPTQKAGGVHSSTSTPRSRVSKRKKKGGSRAGKATFSQLQKEVAEVIKGFAEQTFTIFDVRNALKKNGLKYEDSHLSLVVSKYINGIEMMGKHRPNGTGRPVNTYRVTGSVGVASYTDVKNRS